MISPALSAKLKQFACDIAHGKFSSSYKLACETLSLLKCHVEGNDWATVNELIDDMKQIGQTLREAESSETVPHNTVLRALKIVRDECHRSLNGSTLEDYEHLSILDAIDDVDESPRYDVANSHELKESILSLFEEWSDEIEVAAENIAKEALKHITPNEVILTLGSSKTVESFLKKAATKYSFHVMIAEGSPFNRGHDMAVSLAKANIKTTVIPDSAIFAVMSRATKVIIGTHSVMANGGLKAVSGAYGLALAAKHDSVPLLVLAALFKYTPQSLCSHDQWKFNKIVSPDQLLSGVSPLVSKETSALLPVFDYVPPELVTGLIAGEKEGHAPSYVYHKLSALYHRLDTL